MSKHWADQSFKEKVQTGYDEVTKILERHRKIPRPSHEQGYVEGLDLAQTVLARCLEHKEKEQSANS